jgi:hypothetical protein
MDRNVVRNPRAMPSVIVPETAARRHGGNRVKPLRRGISEHDLVTRGTPERRGTRAMQRCNGDKYDMRG